MSAPKHNPAIEALRRVEIPAANVEMSHDSIRFQRWRNSEEAREAVARAAAQDRGNTHAREHGRRVWNEDDYNAACRTYSAIMGES